MAKPIYVTTQRSSKSFKLLLLLSNIIQIFGILGIFAGLMNQNSDTMISGFYLVGGGIALHVFGRALVWWFND